MENVNSNTISDLEATKAKAVVDTNVLMNIECLNFLKQFIKDGNELIVPLIVTQELDKHAHCTDEHRKFQARTGLRFLNEHEEKITFDLSTNVLEGLSASLNDGIIVSCAVKHEANLITLDMAMRLISKQFGITHIKPNKADDDDVSYKGYRIIELNTMLEKDNNLFASFYNYTENFLELKINEYLIIRDKSCPCYDADTDEYLGIKTLDILRYDGSKLVKIELPLKKHVNPLNDLQKCALDLLNSKSVPIRIVCGKHGSGKSFLATQSAYYQVKTKDNYSKIVLIRNNDMGGKDVGALPGGLEEKTDILFQSIAQHFPMGEEDLMKLRNEEKLKTYVSYFIKGADIGGYVIVDESQDLTLSDIRKIGSRINSNGCINFVGDWRQTDGKYISTSGLVDFIQKTIDNPLVGIVVLEEDVRSDVSKVFAELY